METQGELQRMTYPDGHEGWLATGRSAVRAVLSDDRFSVRPDLMHNPWVDTGGQKPPPPAPGLFGDMDAPDHTRYRRLLTGQFTVRRMRLLEDRIREITADHLDAMERNGPTADLITAFAQPIPALTICELLGVPYEDRGGFQDDIVAVTGSMVDYDALMEALARQQAYIGELVVRKRAEPQDDLISGLTESDLTDEEIANMSLFLLGGGLDTTTNVFATGLLELLREPERVERLRTEPEVVVEEILRAVSIIPMTARSALADVEIDGRLVRAGETVALSIEDANKDLSGGHVSFGHGIHQCIGQQLARVELKVGFPALFDRFPKLRLAVAESELPWRPHALVRGILELPIAWD
ncbi:cytochrome P450 [Lentzea sp. NBRC 105346]|uniref:cytochrome P450 n=1 Tax=Lentzea sp. NBRC 105346 TaxID=3032205 RepID=UPI0024A4B6BC|nr:cytochrome P450 [Lentzea sp. NBRC 105346]GLZ34206.1 cytochrome P450 [Lentzea sp. NBRC 105346]